MSRLLIRIAFGGILTWIHLLASPAFKLKLFSMLSIQRNPLKMFIVQFVPEDGHIQKMGIFPEVIPTAPIRNV